MERRTPLMAQKSANSLEVYWQPRSLWKMTPVGGLRVTSAAARASMTRVVLAGVQVDHGRGVDPALDGAYVGDVSAPVGVGLGGGEVLSDQVWGVDGSLACDGRFLPGPWVASAQAGGLHQAPDPFGGDPDTAHDEFGPDPAHAGVAVQVVVDLADRLGELGVGALALARPVGAPPVVALAGHSELVAHERDRELLVVGPVRDRRVFHGCSFANQAATFFAKSRSILRTALSLRSRSSSARSVSDRSLSGTRPLSFAFFTHLPNVISWTPILLATSVIDRPESRCRLTACSLYSWVKLRRVATRFPPLAISGSHNGCLQDRVRSRQRGQRPVQDVSDQRPPAGPADAARGEGQPQPNHHQQAGQDARHHKQRPETRDQRGRKLPEP